MTKKKTAAIVLAAGKGTRMRSDLPKVLHPLAGRPMVGHVIATARAIGADPLVVVVGPGMEAVSTAVAPHRTVIQERQAGTADAVMAAREALADSAVETVLVLYGDTPLIGEGTLRRVLARRAEGAAIVVLGFRPADPGGYGRLVLDDTGRLRAIVEERDAGPKERAIPLCNSGAMAVEATLLFELAARVGNDNAKGEYYLTDIVALADEEGHVSAVVEAPAEELMGVDSRTDLAAAEALWQSARRRRAMAEGATLLDPDTVWFSFDTVLGRDVTVEPGVIFAPGVRVADGVRIRAFSHLEGAEVGAGAVVGPFARLRPGTRIEAAARIGNFVEVKNALIGEGAKANHLTYIGDAEIGADANIGAGTITCNYDGFAKHRTVIGAGAFIGSNTALVAPVSVGRGAIVGAGSTITRDVDEDALAIERAPQIDLPRRAARFRAERAGNKGRMKARKAKRREPG